MTTTVTTQAEFNAALAAKTTRILIDSPEGVWLTIGDTGESEVEIYGHSSIEEVGDSATIQSVGDSATIQRVGDSATIQSVGGSATIQSVGGSATIQSVGGSATIQRVGGSATIQRVGDSATIQRVGGSATIQRVGGSATIQRVGGSATIQSVGGSATIQSVGDSATIQSVGGSATIQSVGGSATIQSVGGSATIRLYGRAKATNVGPRVAVFLYSAQATFDGGQLIDLTDLDMGDAGTWCEYNGATVTDGKVVLYKAVDADLVAGQGYREITYPIGEQVTAPDWDPEQACGGGLHLCAEPGATIGYYGGGGDPRFLAVEVDLDDLVTLDDKVKVRTLRVLHEVTVGAERLEVTS
jgi:hypothetical protein